MSFSFATKTAATTPTTKHTRPPPAAPYDAKRTKHSEATTSTELFVNNVSIRFPTGVTDSNIRDKMAILFATLQRVDPSLVLLPLKKEDTDLPALLSSSSFPSEVHLLRNYLTIPVFSSKTAKVHCYLQSTMRFSAIKFTPFILAYIKKRGSWMDNHDIESFDVTQIGWFKNRHTEHYSRNYLLEEAKKILPEALHPQMQVNIRRVQYFKSNQESKVTTRAYVLEMDRLASNDHVTDIFNCFGNHEELELIPYNSFFDVDDVFRQAFIQQNNTLNNYRSIRVDNLFGLDAALIEQSGETTTIRELFAAAEDGKHPFLHLTQYNSGRVNFLVKKDDEKWACAIINDFIYDYIAHNLTEDSKNLITKPNKSPRIVGGTHEVPQQIAVYLQSAKKRNPLPVDTTSITSDLTSPPLTQRQTYASVASKKIHRTASPTSHLTKHHPIAHDTTSEASSHISALNTKIEDIIRRSADRHKKIDATQSVIDSQISAMTSNMASIATHFDDLQHQLTKQQSTIQTQTTVLNNTARDLSQQTQMLFQQQQQHEARLNSLHQQHETKLDYLHQQQEVKSDFLQQIVLAIAGQFPNLNLPQLPSPPTQKFSVPNVCHQTDLSSSFSQQVTHSVSKNGDVPYTDDVVAPPIEMHLE